MKPGDGYMGVCYTLPSASAYVDIFRKFQRESLRSLTSLGFGLSPGVPVCKT